MAGNPLIAQGTLNRIIASVVIPTYSQLNVTAPYLGRGGISLALQGKASTQIPTMTGAVQSPEPYQSVMLTLNLLKTQNLAALWKAQQELLALIGAVNVIPDANTLPQYNLFNCAIDTVRDLSFAGEEAGYVVQVSGYYLINSSLWV